MRKSHLLAGAAASLAIAALGLPAAAQSIDYGSLQELFNEPVTTSATGSPQRSTDVPVDMTIISAADIHRSGATDLPTILSRVAGVDVLNFSAGQSDVGVRGYDQARSPRLLVLINGRQVYLDHFGYTDWASLPVELSEIRQIEVVRGPNSAIFGFNAVSGVVNIITVNPKLDKVNVVEAYAGAHGASGGSVVGTFHVGDLFSMRLSAGGDQQDQWRNTTTTIAAANMQDPSVARANVDAIVQLAPKTELRMEGSWSNLAGLQVISTFAYARHRVETNSGKLTLSSDTDYGLVQAQVYQNQLNALTPGRRYLNRITVASVQDLFKIGANQTFRVGLEYRDNRLDTASYAGGLVSYTVLAPSAMWNWVVNPQLSLTAAARYDKLDLSRDGTFPVGSPTVSNAGWDRSISETSLNLGAVYKLTKADNVRLTFARGVQAPTLLELGGLLIPPATPAPTGVLITGNPNLQPAIVTNYELAFDHDFAPIRAKASLKIFSQQTKDVKGQFTTGIVDIPATAKTWTTFTYQNTADSKMTGVEAAASGKLGKGFSWSADTTYTDVKDEPARTAAELILRKVAFAQTTPKFRSNLAAGWTNSTWTVDGFVHMVSKFNSYNGNLLEPVAAYTTVGGRVAYAGPLGLEYAVSGQNLLEERQAQAKGPTGLMAERRVLFTISKAW
jgi:outer membrane receptor for ferrienterochelin and colicins